MGNRLTIMGMRRNGGGVVTAWDLGANEGGKSGFYVLWLYGVYIYNGWAMRIADTVR